MNGNDLSISFGMLVSDVVIKSPMNLLIKKRAKFVFTYFIPLLFHLGSLPYNQQKYCMQFC